MVIVFLCMFAFPVFGAVEYESLRLNQEDIENYAVGTSVSFRMMDMDITTKRLDINDEALRYMEKKGITLTIETPKVTMIFSPESFLTQEWKQAEKSGEPLTFRVVLKKGDISKVTDNFDEWYYNQMGLYRFSTSAWDLSGEVLIGGKKEYDVKNFAVPVTLKVTYPYNSETNSVKENTLELYMLNEEKAKWDYAGGSVNTETKVITLNTNKTGLFIILSNQNPKQFTDINGHWAKNDIQFMLDKNVVQVTGDKKFYPNRDITRAEFAVFLSRTIGLNDNTGNKKFKDVTSDKPYYREVLAAANSGIVAGVSGDRFNPEAKITRQEMAVMLNRALKYAKVSVKTNQDLLNKFSDGKQIAGWAKESVASVVTAGIMGGRQNNSFAPESFASRAEAVVILHRLLNITIK